MVAQIGSGVVELLPDHDRPGGYTLLVDGAPQSHVDLDDPTYLEFEYVRRIATSLDLTAPPLMPLRVLHLGGGGLTLARYLAASRPGSRQRVVEADAKLVDFVREHLPWPPDPRLKVRVGDARTELAKARDDDVRRGDRRRVRRRPYARPASARSSSSARPPGCCTRTGATWST